VENQAVMVSDTTVWVDYSKGVHTKETRILRNEIERGEVIVTDVIIMEFLQGIRDDRDYADGRALMNAMYYRPFWGKRHMEQAAANYRALRKQGITIRSPNDVVIATFCIENDYPLLHNDHDFDHIEQHLGLKVAR
jgi:predicted nucleic acid-binding protein